MIDIENYFRGYRLDEDKAKEYGFTDGEFVREISSLNAKISVSFRNKKTLFILDTAFGDEIVNYMSPTVKTEWENLVLDIRDRCFVKKLYEMPQAERMHAYIMDKYGTDAEFLFSGDKYEDFGIYRNKSGKWYAGIFYTKYASFGRKEKGLVDIINLKSEDVANDSETDGIYPAWHMSKKCWISILLDGEVPDEEIERLIDKSYGLTK